MNLLTPTNFIIQKYALPTHDNTANAKDTVDEISIDILKNEILSLKNVIQYTKVQLRQTELVSYIAPHFFNTFLKLDSVGKK